MNTRFGSLAHATALGLAIATVCPCVSGQDSSAIDAFIAGIDNYDDAVITPPVVGVVEDEVPPNMLPGDEDVVVGAPLVPDEPTATEDTSADNDEAGTDKTDEPVSDYFDSDMAPAADQSYASTWVLGVSVPIFDREFDGDRLFSFNPADLTQTLTSDHADPNGTSGIDLSLSRRNSFGWGFEARYWGLYASATTEVLGGTPTTAISGLSQINDNGTPLSTTFDTADFHALTRDYSFNNVELNFLRNGRTLAPLGRGMCIEWLGGFRYLQFDESLEYAGVSSTNTVIRSALNSSVENSLFGGQVGGRAEWHLFKRASFSMGGKLGLFNNHAQHNIVATNQLQNLTFRRPVISSGPNTNAEFEFGDSKDDLSLLGEFDLGLIYQLTLRSRMRIGYRVLGASNIADSEKNIPANFTDTTVLQSTNTYGDLVLRGGYVGVEVAY